MSDWGRTITWGDLRAWLNEMEARGVTYKVFTDPALQAPQVSITNRSPRTPTQESAQGRLLTKVVRKGPTDRIPEDFEWDRDDVFRVLHDEAQIPMEDIGAFIQLTPTEQESAEESEQQSKGDDFSWEEVQTSEEEDEAVDEEYELEYGEAPPGEPEEEK